MIKEADFEKQIEEIRLARKKRVVVYMLTVFGDESHDEKEERVFAVVGIIGRQEEWDTIEPVWFNRTGGKIFHAANCEANKGDFAGSPHAENLKLYADLTNILAETKLIGCGVAIDINAYRKNFPHVPPGMSYYMCFLAVVLWCGKVASLYVPQQKAKFIFDQNPKTDFNSGQMYNSMINYPEVTFNDYFDEISFASRKKIGIQCADLFAREIMKHADNRLLGTIKRETRKSIQVLLNTERFHFKYYDNKYYEGLKIKTEELDSKSVNGIGQTAFGRWLSKYGLSNNITNRIRYTTYLREGNSVEAKDED